MNEPMKAREIAENVIGHGCTLRASDVELMVLRHMEEHPDALVVERDKLKAELGETENARKAALEKYYRLGGEVEILKNAALHRNELIISAVKAREASDLQVDALMSLLKKCEWAEGYGSAPVKVCPICGQDEPYGHNNDCGLAKVVGSDRYHHPNEPSRPAEGR